MTEVATIVAVLTAAVGVDVVAAEPMAGGDINRALRVRLADGRRLFVKHGADAPADVYRAEAEGLAWLAAAEALPVARVVARGDAPGPGFLALEWIASGAPAADHDERLGRGLAALHRHGAPAFGLDEDSWIGSLPQPDGACATWADFYAERRLLPMTRRAVDAGRLPRTTAATIARLCARLPDLAGPPEPPARLHGDLWSGNAMRDASGGPVLVDPAAYAGHREMDLATMRLFGGFGPRVFAAYSEAWPLAEGREDRVGLWQLYPLLVHAVLFGGGYADRAGDVAARYAGAPVTGR